jgi:signal transduction histidine kinase
MLVPAPAAADPLVTLPPPPFELPVLPLVSSTWTVMVGYGQRRQRHHSFAIQTQCLAARVRSMAWSRCHLGYDRVQLQQVIINLVMNGIEAMRSVRDRRRELVIRSGHDETQMLVGVQRV